MSQPRVPRPLFCGNWKLWAVCPNPWLWPRACATPPPESQLLMWRGPRLLALATVARSSSRARSAWQPGWLLGVKGAFTGEVAMAQIATRARAT